MGVENMIDLSIKMQAVTMLANELHISLKDAAEILKEMVALRHKIDRAQKEAAAMVEEMLD